MRVIGRRVKGKDILSYFAGVDENACMLLKYKNGGMANLTYHTNAGHANNMGLIMGQKGKIQYSRLCIVFFSLFHFSSFSILKV